MSNDFRVRYGKNTKGARQSALVTVREGDLIFFGISKCHPKKDKFDKALAMEIALGRAQKAMEEYRKKPESCGGNLDRSMFINRGVVGAENTPALVVYFRELNNAKIRFDITKEVSEDDGD